MRGRRRRAATLLFSVVILSLVGPAGVRAQEAPRYDIFDTLLDAAEQAFEGPEGRAYRLEVLNGRSRRVFRDPSGDFQHSTGFEPGFTPRHLDMTQVVKTGVIHPTPETMPFFADRANGGPWCDLRRFAHNPEMFSMCSPDSNGTGQAFSEGHWS